MTAKRKVVIGIIIAVAAVAIIRLLISIGFGGVVLFDSFVSKPEVYDDIESYTEHVSFGAQMLTLNGISGVWMKAFGLIP